MRTETADFSAQLRDCDDIAAQWVRLSGRHKADPWLTVEGDKRKTGGRVRWPDLLHIKIWDGVERLGVEVCGSTAGSLYIAPWTELPLSAEYVYGQLAQGDAPRIAQRNRWLIIETWNAFIGILEAAPPPMERMHEEYDLNA
jgi:hypothetical protein